MEVSCTSSNSYHHLWQQDNLPKGRQCRKEGSPESHIIHSVRSLREAQTVYFQEVQFIMLFENVTLSNRCYFWSPGNFIFVKKALAEVKRWLARRSGWYMRFRSRLLSCNVTVYMQRQKSVICSLPVAAALLWLMLPGLARGRRRKMAEHLCPQKPFGFWYTSCPPFI